MDSMTISAAGVSPGPPTKSGGLGQRGSPPAGRLGDTLWGVHLGRLSGHKERRIDCGGIAATPSASVGAAIR
jgi:hypothetical protein